MKKISIIIPLYNAEEFIERCLLSIINQTYTNLEIIVINDGSTDDSEEKCLKIQNRDSRIKYYKIDNGGVSNARNYGLNIATGDYITFVDADDFISEKTYDECMKIAEKYNPDIIKFNFVLESNKYYYITNISTDCNVLISKKQYKEKVYNNIFSSGDYSNIWNALIKREIIEELRFDKNLKFGEDFLFMVQTLFKSKSIYYIDKRYYHYIYNNNSATKNYNDNKIKEQIININIVLNTIYSYIKNTDFDKKTYKNRLISDLKECYDKIKKCSNYKNYLSIHEYMMTHTQFMDTLENFNEEEKKEIIKKIKRDSKNKFYINKMILLLKEHIRFVMLNMKIRINEKYIIK